VKPIPPGGVSLLTADEAISLLGVSATRFAFLSRFLQPMTTRVGLRYREDALLELRAVLPPPEPLKPGEAARILGVTVPTLRRAAGEGRVHRDKQGRYDPDEIHALNRVRAGRKTLRVPEWLGKAS
jgi:hypothetical protein